MKSAISPPRSRSKLLRFLDSGELVRVGETQARRVDAQVVSATNRRLEKDVADGVLRADLLARLGHMVELPPLRDRREDIPLLLDYYLDAYGGRARGKSFSADAIEVMQGYDWPLNVRELQLVVERAVCMSERPAIGPGELPAHLRHPAAQRAAPAAAAPRALAVSRRRCRRSDPCGPSSTRPNGVTSCRRSRRPAATAAAPRSSSASRPIRSIAGSAISESSPPTSRPSDPRVAGVRPLRRLSVRHLGHIADRDRDPLSISFQI